MFLIKVNMSHCTVSRMVNKYYYSRKISLLKSHDHKTQLKFPCVYLEKDSNFFKLNFME